MKYLYYSDNSAPAGKCRDRVFAAVIAGVAPRYDSDFWRARALYTRTHGLDETVRRLPYRTAAQASGRPGLAPA